MNQPKVREKDYGDDDDQEEKDNDETQEGLGEFLNGRPSESDEIQEILLEI